MVEARVEAVLRAKDLSPQGFLERVQQVEDAPHWSWARESTADVVRLLRQCDSFPEWAAAMSEKAARRRHK